MEKTILFLGQLLECAAGVSFCCVPNTTGDVSDFLKSSTKHILDRVGVKDNESFRPQIEANTFSRHSILDTITFYYTATPTGILSISGGRY